MLPPSPPKAGATRPSLPERGPSVGQAATARPGAGVSAADVRVALAEPHLPSSPGERRSAQLTAIERSPAFAAAVKATAFEVLRIPGHDVDVLLPSAGPGQDTFAEYARRLAKTCSFPEQVESLRALEGVSAVAGLPLAADPRPVVGVLLNEPEQLLTDRSRSVRGLVDLIEKMGCRPVLVPPRADLLLPTPASASDRMKRWAGLTALVSKLDGLAGPGGADVHPRLYGQLNRHSLETNYPRDRFEADVALVALRSDVYMLGICRSHQLWNAASGGALVQDVRKEGYSSFDRNQEHHGIAEDQPMVVRDDAGRVVRENRVFLTRGRLRAIVGPVAGRDQIVTNAFHHQAVATPGAPFAVAGVVKDEGTGRTAIEATEASNAITVQWHPELAVKWSAADRELLATFGRRVHVFQRVRQLRAAGLEPTADRLVDGLALSAADRAWVRADLQQRLARRAG